MDEESSDESVHSPREYFHSFLHSLDAEVEGLPEAFRTKIARALRIYDVDSLEPGPELEEAVYRLFLALQRIENVAPVERSSASLRSTSSVSTIAVDARSGSSVVR